MKILRLGLSDDSYRDLGKEQRSWFLAQEALARETGLPWETRIINARPHRRLAADVGATIDEYEPDMVHVSCPAFFVCYPSVPLRLRRSRLPFSGRIARGAQWLSQRSSVSGTRAFHRARALMTRGGAHSYFYDPEEALANTEEAIRLVLRREQIALGVRGPLPFAIPGPEAVQEEGERRRAAFNAGLEDLCERLHIPYLGFGPEDRHPPEELLEDRIHVNAAGHVRRGQTEGDLMIRAWKAHTAPSGD